MKEGAEMFTAKQCEVGAETGKWYTVIVERAGQRRTGYCALACAGHDSAADALAHHLQYQLDREANLWLERRTQPRNCEICGQTTTMRARLGRDMPLFILCRPHQSTNSLRILFQQRIAQQLARVPA
jgi:hypothetical protein